MKTLTNPIVVRLLLGLVILAGLTGVALAEGQVYSIDGDRAGFLQEYMSGSDPTVSDTDNDGLEDHIELELGSGVRETDTDGDGISDFDEHSNRHFDPISPQNSDGDGLTSLEEFQSGTNPTSNDTDGDGLDDGREIQLGLNATIPDTDGDSLPDSWEVGNSPPGINLEDSDPLHKDIYLQVYVLADVEDQHRRQLPVALEELKSEFEGFPVANPDGESGIRVHVKTRDIEYTGEEVISFHDEFEGEYVYEAHIGYVFFTPDYMAKRYGTEHLMVIIQEDDMEGGASGKAEPGGRVSRIRSPSSRVLIHELLHNIVGEFRDPPGCEDRVHHTCEGYLSYNSDENYLSEFSANRLNERGFATRLAFIPEWQGGGPDDEER